VVIKMPTKEEVAFRLAQSHFAVEPGISMIFRLLSEEARENEPREPVKLLEVNEDSIPVGIRPVYFRPHSASGIVFPSAIIEITPEEFDQLSRGDATHRLPPGWRIGYPIERSTSPQGAAR
jgi:hypothetical protein